MNASPAVPRAGTARVLATYSCIEGLRQLVGERVDGKGGAQRRARRRLRQGVSRRAAPRLDGRARRQRGRLLPARLRARAAADGGGLDLSMSDSARRLRGVEARLLAAPRRTAGIDGHGQPVRLGERDSDGYLVGYIDEHGLAWNQLSRSSAQHTAHASPKRSASRTTSPAATS
jgi:hypothetical protein